MHENHFFHVSLKLILKNKDGKILLLKMPDDSSMSEYYDVPGGRITKDEFNISFEETIKREITEELGTDIKYRLNMKPVSYGVHTVFSKSIGKEIQMLMLFFEAEYLDGAILLSDEHMEYVWENVNDANVKQLFIRGLLEGVSNYLKFKTSN